MNGIANLRVHIAPVGFEIDRIVIPIKKMKADRVWLLVHDNPTEDKGRPYVEKIQNQLRKMDVKVEIFKVNRLELFKIIKAVINIVEKEKRNDIYVNVASGSKIHAIACMMACMILRKKKNIMPFYVEAEKYAAFEGVQQSSGVKKMMSLPTYEIQTPKPEIIAALKIIREKGGRITKKEMAQLADDSKIIMVGAREENYEQARFASLDKNIIQPLVDQWKFAEVEKIGRNRWIKITESGSQAAEFLI
jgi:CRISPR locus-related DNA-binding protein